MPSPAPGETPETPAEPGFDALYGGEEREAIRDLARAELEKGSDSAEQARAYAAKGKPDFTLAYLLAGALADDERRAIYAEAFERRAELTETKARDLDKQFHRPFPMLYSDAAQDRALARRVRDGRGFGSGAGKQLPMI
jgi:hypothetical protein